MSQPGERDGFEAMEIGAEGLAPTIPGRRSPYHHVWVFLRGLTSLVWSLVWGLALIDAVFVFFLGKPAKLSEAVVGSFALAASARAYRHYAKRHDLWPYSNRALFPPESAAGQVLEYGSNLGTSLIRGWRAATKPGATSWRRTLVGRCIELGVTVLVIGYLWVVWSQWTGSSATFMSGDGVFTLGQGRADHAVKAAGPFGLFDPIMRMHQICYFPLVVLCVDGLLRIPLAVWRFTGRESSTAWESSRNLIKPSDAVSATPRKRAVRLLAFLLTLWCVMAVPLPRIWRNPHDDFTGVNTDVTGFPKLKMMHAGVWCNVYYHPYDDKKLIKQFHLAGYGHSDYEHIAIPLPYKQCLEYCPLPFAIIHIVALYAQTATMLRIPTFYGDSHAFPTTSELDINTRRVVVSRIPTLSTDHCESDLIEQLEDVSASLEAHRFYLDDAHANNWMWNPDAANPGHQSLVSVDGELYSELEYLFAHFLVHTMDVKNVGTLSLPACHRCYHWQDGPRKSLKMIIEGQGWYPYPEQSECYRITHGNDEEAKKALEREVDGEQLDGKRTDDRPPGLWSHGHEYGEKSLKYACYEPFNAAGGRASLSAEDLKRFEIFDRKVQESANTIWEFYGPQPDNFWTAKNYQVQ